MIHFNYISDINFIPRYPIKIHERHRGYGPAYYSFRALVNFQLILDHPFIPFCPNPSDGYECFEDESEIVIKVIRNTDDGKPLMYPVKAVFEKRNMKKAIVVSDLKSYKYLKVWIPLHIAEDWENFQFQQSLDL